MAWALTGLARALGTQKRYAEAQTYAAESLAHSRSLQDPLGIALALTTLSDLALNASAPDEALTYIFESLSLRWQLADWHGSTVNIAQLAQLHKQINEPAKAVMLVRLAQREFEKIGVPSTEVSLDEIFETARTALSPEEFAAAWAEGEARSLADVVEELLHPNEAVEEVGRSE